MTTCTLKTDAQAVRPVTDWSPVLICIACLEDLTSSGRPGTPMEYMNPLELCDCFDYPLRRVVCQYENARVDVRYPVHETPTYWLPLAEVVRWAGCLRGLVSHMHGRTQER